MEIIYLGVRDKARRAHGSLDFDSTRILFPIPIELGGMLFLDLPLVSPYLRDRERVSLGERERERGERLQVRWEGSIRGMENGRKMRGWGSEVAGPRFLRRQRRL